MQAPDVPQRAPPPRRRLPSPLRLAVGRLMRLLLPLGAVVLLSTIFLLARNIDAERAVEMSGLDVETLTMGPRIGAARIAGVTQDDIAMTIHAASIRSDSDLESNEPLLLSLDAPQGRLDFDDARRVWFEASAGRIDQDADAMLMDGDVMLETSDGYRLRMPVLQAALSQVDVRGSGGIRGDGPSGEITADRLHLTRPATARAGYLLAFEGNVRLIYLPEE